MVWVEVAMVLKCRFEWLRVWVRWVAVDVGVVQVCMEDADWLMLVSLVFLLVGGGVGHCLIGFAPAKALILQSFPLTVEYAWLC